MIAVAPLGESHLDAWRALFVACDCACFCRYWHFEGDKNAWLARCASEPEENDREQSALVSAGDATARGLLALDGDRAVGWMKLAPSFAKMRNVNVHRKHEWPSDALVVGCFLVHPEWRRKGVARELVRAAPAYARSLGAKSIEAFPHTEPTHDEQIWRGPHALFASEGWQVIGGELPYPIYRLSLTPT